MTVCENNAQCEKSLPFAEIACQKRIQGRVTCPPSNRMAKKRTGKKKERMDGKKEENKERKKQTKIAKGVIKGFDTAL